MAPMSPGGSSTSASRPSRRSRRSARASSTSRSPGNEGAVDPGESADQRRPASSGQAAIPPLSLTPSSLRALAERHGIRPRKSLGQHFLIEPALARRIAELAEAGPGSRVVEVGPGLGSLTVALAERGAEVAAVEVDPGLLPALREAVAPFEIVRVVRADAVTVDWREVLGPAPATWSMVANLPYNVAVPVLMRVLDEEPRVDRFLVMVQAEVGRRICAGPGDPEYGSVSVRVAYRADARVVRPISRTVFWPRPNVDSVLVRMDRRAPPVDADEESLLRLVRESFAHRRKTMAGALVRLGMSRFESEAALQACDLSPTARPEELGLESFACLTERWRAVGAS